MTEKFFLDTNILVYAHDSSEPKKQRHAQELVFEGLRSHYGVLSIQVLSEFFVVVTKKIPKPLSINHAKKEIELLAHLEVCELDLNMIRHAIEHQKKFKINYWDGLIIAAAQKSHCQLIYSEDLNHSQNYGETKVINPFK